LIMGFDIVGVVDNIGSSVKGLKVGDNVVAMTTLPSQGALAEYCVCEEDTTVVLPPGVDPVEAAAAPLAAMTALQMIQFANVKEGHRVFVAAGAGGVGHYCIQLCRILGAKDIVTTSSAAKHPLLRKLGATVCVDYTKVNIVEQFGTNNKFDVALDCVGQVDQLLKITKEGGSVVSAAQAATPESFARFGKPMKWIVRFFLWAMSRGMYSRAAKLKISLRGVFLFPNAKDLTYLVEQLEKKTLTSITEGNVFDGIEKSAEAVAKLESGRVTGKVIVRIA